MENTINKNNPPYTGLYYPNKPSPHRWMYDNVRDTAKETAGLVSDISNAMGALVRSRIGRANTDNNTYRNARREIIRKAREDGTLEATNMTKRHGSQEWAKKLRRKLESMQN